MSTTGKKFTRLVFLCALILPAFFVCSAQDVEVTIKLISPEAIHVAGKFLPAETIQTNKNWTFLQSAGNIKNLGARISDFNLADKNEQLVEVKKITDEEYLAQPGTNAWNYRINLKPPPDERATAHISWLKDEQGILMLDDLLPQFAAGEIRQVSAKIHFELPSGWKILSSEKLSDKYTFYTNNIQKAIFFIGKNWRETNISSGNNIITLAISGEWNFSDQDAIEMTREIFDVYRNLFGKIPGEKVQIAFVHFPKDIKFGRWEAETRGTNLTIFSSDMPFQTLARQRLHEQLRHELFHLWIPNKLALTGNYDWFYEGFTVYQSLKTGVRMNQIRFEDFLDTIWQAYQLDSFQTQKISLIEASINRWSDANQQVYARGMLIAFLCDAALLRQSSGKREIADVFRQIYTNFGLLNKPQNGNIAVLNVLANYPELQPIIEKYIKGTGKIDWQTALESIGIEISKTDFVEKLNVKSKLNGRQKDLLERLGYNNWRKFPVKAK